MSECAPFRLNKYMSSTRFEGIILSLRYTKKMMLKFMMGYSTCVKCKKYGTLTWLKNLIHRGSIYLLVV